MLQCNTACLPAPKWSAARKGNLMFVSWILSRIRAWLSYRETGRELDDGRLAGGHLEAARQGGCRHGLKVPLRPPAEQAPDREASVAGPVPVRRAKRSVGVARRDDPKLRQDCAQIAGLAHIGGDCGAAVVAARRHLAGERSVRQIAGVRGSAEERIDGREGRAVEGKRERRHERGAGDARQLRSGAFKRRRPAEQNNRRKDE